MILENSIQNELNTFIGITDSTLNIIQEFLSVIEDATTLTSDITKKSGDEISALAYKAYINNYEFFRSKVCQQDAVIFEKLINYICMSSYATISLKKFPEFKNNYYISDHSQLGANGFLSTFNTPVGIEYKLYYKTETFSGVSVASDKFSFSSKYSLSNAYNNLFSQSNMKKISDGLIKVIRFKDGSSIKMKFLINTPSLDEFKININKILNEEFFKKWQFKGLCNDLELLQIRYIFKIKNDLEHIFNLPGDKGDLKSIDLITYKCISWVISTMQFRAISGLNPTSGILTEIREIVVPLCIIYFIPEKDRELFYKLINYITYATPSNSTMGYNGLTEINREKTISILENMGKMERLLGKVIYNKSISKKDMTLRLNTFYHRQPLTITSLSDLEYMIGYITNLESYKKFNPGTNDDSFLTQTTKVEPFKHLGISEEGMYLALMAVNALYKIPDYTIRNNSRADIIKRAKRFVDANEYERFSEIIIKFTTEEENKFCYVPPTKMNLDISIFGDFYCVFTEDMFIKKDLSLFGAYKMPVNNGYSAKKTINNTNNLLQAYKDINQLFLDGLVIDFKKQVVDSANDCFIAITPTIDELSWVFSEHIISGCPHLRNKKIANLVESVLGIEYGFIASPKEGVEYEEYNASITDTNNIYQEGSVIVTPINNIINGVQNNDIESNTNNCDTFQQIDNTSVTKEQPCVTDITSSQNICNQTVNTTSTNNNEDSFIFNWLAF